MEYVSIKGFGRYAGDLSDEIEEKLGDVVDFRLGECESRVLAYIFPNTPVTAEDVDAFCRAVYSQFVYENDARFKDVRDLPPGVKRFRIGEFEMQFEPGQSMSGLLRKSSVSPAAYGILLRQGLLYKGVERVR